MINLAMKASEFGKNHCFDFNCFFVNSGCSYLLNKSPVVQLFILNKKQTLTHFPRKSCSLPSLVANAHQKWLIMDLVHFCKAGKEDFLPAAISLLLMFFEKCQTPN